MVLVQKDLKNAYIGEYQEEWQPWANTLLYLPMNSTDTYLDKSWNNVQTTNSWVTFWEYQWVDCGYFNRNHIQITPFSIPLNTTLLCWCYNTGVYQSSYDGKVFDARNNSNNLWTAFVPASNQCLTFVNWTNVATSSCPQNQWVLIIVTNTDWQQNISVKWNWIDLSTDGTVGFSTFTPTYINVGNEWNNWASRYFLWGMSELILEDKIRTAQEKLNYYNQTKSLYGIS